MDRCVSGMSSAWEHVEQTGNGLSLIQQKTAAEMVVNRTQNGLTVQKASHHLNEGVDTFLME